MKPRALTHSMVSILCLAGVPCRSREAQPSRNVLPDKYDEHCLCGRRAEDGILVFSARTYFGGNFPTTHSYVREHANFALPRAQAALILGRLGYPAQTMEKNLNHIQMFGASGIPFLEACETTTTRVQTILGNPIPIVTTLRQFCLDWSVFGMKLPDQDKFIIWSNRPNTTSKYIIENVPAHSLGQQLLGSHWREFEPARIGNFLLDGDDVGIKGRALFTLVYLYEETSQQRYGVNLYLMDKTTGEIKRIQAISDIGSPGNGPVNLYLDPRDLAVRAVPQ